MTSRISQALVPDTLNLESNPWEVGRTSSKTTFMHLQLHGFSCDQSRSPQLCGRKWNPVFPHCCTRRRASAPLCPSMLCCHPVRTDVLHPLQRSLRLQVEVEGAEWRVVCSALQHVGGAVPPRWQREDHWLHFCFLKRFLSWLWVLCDESRSETTASEYFWKFHNSLTSQTLFVPHWLNRCEICFLSDHFKIVLHAKSTNPEPNLNLKL